MELQFNSTINEGLYLKNPQSTTVGKAIIRESILMMAETSFIAVCHQFILATDRVSDFFLHSEFERRQK